MRYVSIISTGILAIGLLWLLGLWAYQPVTLLPCAAVAIACGIWRRKHWEARFRSKPWLWALLAVGIVAYLLLPGPQPEAWQAPWARAPQFKLDGNDLSISNLRDFRYRTETDFDPRYRTETYDLATLTGADFAECHWDGHEAICHTMISFSFADGRRLVVSPETRLPLGETQNALGGLYKRYGLLYVFGTEDDIFALRTNYRHEDLSLMPMRITPAAARAMLLRFVALQEEAEKGHAAYNTVTRNCSSGIMAIFRSLAPGMPWYYDIAPIHNSSISRILFKHNALQTKDGESWDQFRRRVRLGYDLPVGEPGVYSRAIRAKIHATQP